MIRVKVSVLTAAMVPDLTTFLEASESCRGWTCPELLLFCALARSTSCLWSSSSLCSFELRRRHSYRSPSCDRKSLDDTLRLRFGQSRRGGMANNAKVARICDCTSTVCRRIKLDHNTTRTRHPGRGGQHGRYDRDCAQPISHLGLRPVGEFTVQPFPGERWKNRRCFTPACDECL